MKIEEETWKSSLRKFIELKVVFTILEYFEFGIEMEVFHLLDQDVMVDTKL